jgi:hypothetical protein
MPLICTNALRIFFFFSLTAFNCGKAWNKYALYEAALQEPEADIEWLEQASDAWLISLTLVSREIFLQAYRGWVGRFPARFLLREDFCGSAFLSAAWLKRDEDRYALGKALISWGKKKKFEERHLHRSIGLDIDPEALAYGRKHNIDPLGNEAQRRVRLLCTDVCDPLPEDTPRAHLIVALNYSYSLLQPGTPPRCRQCRVLQAHALPSDSKLLEYFRRVWAGLQYGGLFVLDCPPPGRSSAFVQSTDTSNF